MLPLREKELENFYPVILAGGRGTRFWPRSRTSMSKQVLALDGKETMIQQTVERLAPLAQPKRFWVITNEHLRRIIAEQLDGIPKPQIMAEPAARNTAPAIGLAAFILQRQNPAAVIGMFPADHVIKDEKRFRKTVARAVELASVDENIVVMGIKPTRPETGYGYIELGDKLTKDVLFVRRFTEKPNAEKAEEFVSAGNYFWNSGIFVWSAGTLAKALREHLSETAPFLEKIAEAYGTRAFHKTFEKLYPLCENISIDYAVLEPRSTKGEHSSHLFCIPAEFGWNDLGSWAALYEHRAAKARQNGKGSNVIEAKGKLSMDADGNYIYAPNKFVAAVGVNDVVVVETDDALLVTTREKSQDVGKLVKQLEELKKKKLL